MLKRWLGRVLLYCEQQFKQVKRFAGVAQVMASIEAESQTTSTKKAG